MATHERDDGEVGGEVGNIADAIMAAYDRAVAGGASPRAMFDALLGAGVVWAQKYRTKPEIPAGHAAAGLLADEREKQVALIRERAELVENYAKLAKVTKRLGRSLQTIFKKDGSLLEDDTLDALAEAYNMVAWGGDPVRPVERVKSPVDTPKVHCNSVTSGCFASIQPGEGFAKCGCLCKGCLAT